MNPSDSDTLPPPGPTPELASAFRHHGHDGALRLRWQGLAGSQDVVLDRTMVLGSSVSVDVRVAHPTVSRLHAELELDADRVWIRDLGSSNGTFVDRVQVKTARVTAGQVVRLGSAELFVELAEVLEATGPALWPEPKFGPLVGQTAAMRALFSTLAKVAATDVPVLIRGETGTGKELVARAIHDASSRATAPYVIVDCGALTETLLESELFGHTRGAFTGASTTREGAFETARGGTIFLDEIGELPLPMQPKLLRVLEQRTVRRLGESKHRAVDFRLVTATHRDLVDFVAKGWFREDLYFRLAVVPVRVPALRERMDDLEPLVRHFLGEAGASLVTPALLAALGRRTWKGNIRELRNVLDRARALGIERALAGSETTDQGPPSTPTLPNGEVLGGLGDAVLSAELMRVPHRDFRERWADLGERAYLRAKLESHGGNVSKVAREIELARTYLHKLMRKHRL